MTPRISLAILVSLALTASAGAQEPPPDPKAGHLVEWEGWSFRWSIRKVEGLVLTDVKFRGRQVLKYAGLCELVAPYAHGYRTRDFSLNEGWGSRIEELVPGRDCNFPDSCKAFNAEGKEEGKRVVMLHEEPLGIIFAGPMKRAQGKMLVLWSMTRFPGPGGGYVFMLRWRFRTDGSLLPEIGATGALQFPGAGESAWKPNGKNEGRGTLVGTRSPDLKDDHPYLAGLKPGEKVVAPSHVHCFFFRLDFDIDGADNNAVEEFNYEPDQPGSALASGRWTRLTEETGRSLNPQTFRSWRVVNPGSKNALGHPRSYQLIPGGNGSYRGDKKDVLSQADLWVTRNHSKEFPFSTADKRRTFEALPSYLNGEGIGGQDVVVWYVLHFQHQPRTEDWFEMPAAWMGFELMPRDFLDGSPLAPGR